MHYKRRSRRRDKRFMLYCGCCEDIRGGPNAPRPDESETCMGKARGRKKTPPKKETKPVRCPNGQHEWYTEVIVTKDYTLACEHDLERGYGYVWGRSCACSWTITSNPFKKVWFNRYVEKKTCIHCWKVRTIREWDDNPLASPGWRDAYRKRLKLKRRQVDTVSGMTLRN